MSTRSLHEIVDTGTILCLTNTNNSYTRQWYTVSQDYLSKFPHVFQANEFTMCLYNLRYIATDPVILDNVLSTPIDPALRFVKLEYPNSSINLRKMNRNQRMKTVREYIRKQQAAKTFETEHRGIKNYKELINIVGDAEQSILLPNLEESVKVQPKNSFLHFETTNTVVYYWYTDVESGLIN